ncbi:MAG TPA: peptide ABC transporter substrate-binding protein, partial [Verrucomicrobia bacterium]|nr:peptide ABC transporter substrate-binding protein [Verrucomicrobiota bacterium]
ETLGIQVKLRQAEHKVYLAAQSALDYHVTRSSWIGDYNDPNTFLDMFMTQNGNNRTGWSSADYDRLIRLANATTDPAKRNELFRQAETILIADELPILPIFFYVGINIYNPNRIGGIHPNILDIHPISAIYAKKASSAAKK